LLFERQLDVHSYTPTTYRLGSPIGGLHDSRTTSGHDGKPKLGDLTCDLNGLLVLWGLLPESGGTKDGDARPDEMEGSKALDEFPSNLNGEVEFFPSGLTAFKELDFFAIWCHLCLPGGDDSTTRVMYQIG
jgi:hypothetical protein